MRLASGGAWRAKARLAPACNGTRDVSDARLHRDGLFGIQPEQNLRGGIERGERNVALVNIEKIARALENLPFGIIPLSLTEPSFQDSGLAEYRQAQSKPQLASGIGYRHAQNCPSYI